MRRLVFALCFASAVIVAPARADPEVYASLERIAEVAARLESEYCDPDRGRVFQGALDSVNALRERSGAARIEMRTRDIEGFADAYSDLLLAPGADYIALEQAAISGMISAFDESGEHHPADYLRRPRDGGIFVTIEGNQPHPIIINAFPDGPAAWAGVLPGDRLIAIDGEPTTGERLYETIARLTGAVGSDVSITVERNGAPLTFTMQRERNNRRAATWRVVENVGVITAEAFPEHSGRDIGDAIRDIRRELPRPAGYILDLRDNSGGLLDQIIEAADQFIDRGPVLIVQPFGQCADNRPQTYNVRRDDETAGARLVVLVNANTASGAELIAASLRELRGAVLVGQPTYGNGRVHTVIPMNGGRDGYLRIRTGTLTTPAGATWESGLAPDIVTEPRDGRSDPALARAIALLHEAPAATP